MEHGVETGTEVGALIKTAGFRIEEIHRPDAQRKEILVHVRAVRYTRGARYRAPARRASQKTVGVS